MTSFLTFRRAENLARAPFKISIFMNATWFIICYNLLQESNPRKKMIITTSDDIRHEINHMSI